MILETEHGLAAGVIVHLHVGGHQPLMPSSV